MQTLSSETVIIVGVLTAIFLIAAMVIICMRGPEKERAKRSPDVLSVEQPQPQFPTEYVVNIQRAEEWLAANAGKVPAPSPDRHEWEASPQARSGRFPRKPWAAEGGIYPDLQTGEYPSTEAKKIKKQWSSKKWQAGLQEVWSGRLEINFGYDTRDSGCSRRDVRLERIMLSENEEMYFYGFCYLRGEYRSFNVARIHRVIIENTVRTFFHLHELLNLLGVPLTFDMKWDKSREKKVDKKREYLFREYQVLYAWQLRAERVLILKKLWSRRFAMRKVERATKQP